MVSAPLSPQAPGRPLHQTPRPPLPPAPYLVVGLGRAGFAAARALAGAVGAAAVRAWDGAADTAQLERAAELRRIGVEVRLGDDGLDALGGARTVVKSPGVPPEIPVVAEALRRGTPLVDELEIGWHLVPAPVVAVTGTKGKSTTSDLCVEMLRANGLDPVLTGNTDFGPPLSELALGEPPDSLVAEVSSFQAEFAAGLAVDAAAFTNLAPDHVNRHKTMEEYGAAKRRLFVRGEWCVPLAALNRDDAMGRRLAAEVAERGGTALTYGFGADADYRILDCRWDLRRAEVALEAPGGRLQLETRLPGLHNTADLVAVLALSDGLGMPREATLEALSQATPPSGRFEVLEHDSPFEVVVDRALMPDSVENVLKTARRAVAPAGRLLVVLSIMADSAPVVGRKIGAAARELSDHLVLSATSYRGEPRLVALAALAAGARGASGGRLEVVIDRRRAIARALSLAREGDVVAILGRGDTTREATDRRGGFRDLDDRDLVRELI
ncbi:MAG TPA: Mur ligase family protein [Solirubrobacterales bacterium]|nr:Mur ligase family protein [Solirubrobacterales bacterium]